MAKIILKCRTKANHAMAATTSPDAFWSSLLLLCVDGGPPGRLREGPCGLRWEMESKALLSFMRKLLTLLAVIPGKKSRDS